MKLVKIEDVRVGQIYLYGNYYILVKKNVYNKTIYKNHIVTSHLCNTERCFKIFTKDFNEIKIKDEDDYNPSQYHDSFDNLVGFIDITHKIEDNKLIEIPRKEFEVDDVVFFINNDDCPQEYYHDVFGVINWICDDYDKEDYDEDNYDKEKPGIGIEATVLDGSGYVLIDLQLYSDTTPMSLQKLGILGVNYEFINERLTTNNEVK